MDGLFDLNGQPQAVDFRPPKRLKRRKDLDALLSDRPISKKLKQMGRKRLKMNGAHMLLQDNSNSSEDDFNLEQAAAHLMAQKRNVSCLSCSTFGLCICFIITAASLALSIGLMFVYLNLQKEVLLLRKHTNLVSASNFDLKLQRSYYDDVAKNLTYCMSMQKNISLLQQKFQHFQTSTPDSHPSDRVKLELKSVTTLQASVKSLSETLAEQESVVLTMQKTVNQLSSFREDIKSRLATLQSSFEQFKNATTSGDSFFSAASTDDVELAIIALKTDVTRLKQGADKNTALLDIVSNNTESLLLVRTRLDAFSQHQTSLSETVSRVNSSTYDLRDHIAVLQHAIRELETGPNAQNKNAGNHAMTTTQQPKSTSQQMKTLTDSTQDRGKYKNKLTTIEATTTHHSVTSNQNSSVTLPSNQNASPSETANQKSDRYASDLNNASDNIDNVVTSGNEQGAIVNEQNEIKTNNTK